MSKFAHFDTKRADGVYVSFERVETHDSDVDPMDYLFQDEEYRREDQARLDAWRNDDWHFIGIMARATVEVVRNGVGTIYNLESAGLWGTESDSGEEHLASVFAEECDSLKGDIEALRTLPVLYAA